MSKINSCKFNCSPLIVALCMIIGLTQIGPVKSSSPVNQIIHKKTNSSHEPDHSDKFECKVHLVMSSIVPYDQYCYYGHGANTCICKPEFKVGEIQFERCEYWKVDYIDKSKVCDGVIDCVDLSDERKCSRCSKDTFSCDGYVCIPKRWRCDQIVDCHNGADEKNCEFRNCTENEFQCGNSRCIDESLYCNGEDDCGDRSDEKTCSNKTHSNNFDCRNLYIPEKWHCDGIVDCYNGLDEKKCPSPKYCKMNQFKCDNRKCIDIHSICDGVADCWDRSDEKNCDQTNCAYNQFNCGNQCIPIRWKCDNKYDCLNGSDEWNCNQNMYKLRRDDSRLKWVDGLFPCNDNSGYVSTDFLCDGYSNCKDQSDEKNCPSRVINQLV